MPTSANTAGGRRVTRWTRETIIAKILEWNARFGEPPCSADWNPSLARWRAQEWRIERYRAGEWPSTNAAKRPFGGSFDAAVRAAGLEPHRSGPRRRAPGLARPDVAQRAPLPPRSVDEALLEAADRVRVSERRAAELRRALALAERRAARAEVLLSEARARARRAAERTRRARTAREQVAERTADANARVRAAYDQAEAAVADTREARILARDAELRAADAEARAEAAERLLAAATARAERAADSAVAGVAVRSADADGAARPAAGVAVRSADADGATRPAAGAAPRAVADGAAVRAALAAARAAEERAAAAERRARELAALVCGEPRQLTRGELARLRGAGPTGPAVMANALRTLHRARAAGDRHELTTALGDVASAAVGWRDRL